MGYLPIYDRNSYFLPPFIKFGSYLALVQSSCQHVFGILAENWQKPRMKWSSAPILPILCVSNEVPAGLESSVFSSSQKSSGGSQVSFSVNYATADPYGSTDYSLYLCETTVFRLSIPMRPLFLCKLSFSSIKVANTMDKIDRFGGFYATAFQDRSLVCVSFSGSFDQVEFTCFRNRG